MSAAKNDAAYKPRVPLQIVPEEKKDRKPAANDPSKVILQFKQQPKPVEEKVPSKDEANIDKASKNLPSYMQPLRKVPDRNIADA